MSWPGRIDLVLVVMGTVNFHSQLVIGDETSLLCYIPQHYASHSESTTPCEFMLQPVAMFLVDTIRPRGIFPVL